MSILEGKKILYIGVSTFNYEKEIKSSLENMGALVDYYDERPANDFLTKVFIRLKLRGLIQAKIKNYYSSILHKIKDIKYDYVLVIKLETIDQNILEQLKINQKSATFILYLWDSIKNYKGKEKLLPYFDKAYSFDKTDVLSYDKLLFLPLFYIPLYGSAIPNNECQKYDLCFIGSGHTDRYRLIKEIESKAKELDLNTFTFFYLDNKIIFWVRKILDKRMRHAKFSDFSFTPLNQKQVLNKILESNVIIDIEHEGQVGLTMRTIEMIGCQKKLLTTNKSIKGYDFYNDKNISLIDRRTPTLDKSFFNLPYQELDNAAYEKYSLKHWLTSIFS